MSITARERACYRSSVRLQSVRGSQRRLASSSGAKPVPYRRIPLTSPNACLNAVPRAIAVSCVSAGRDEGARSRCDYETGKRKFGLISRMVVVDLEIAFGLERESHSAVLREGVVHLCIMGTCRSHFESGLHHDENVRDRGSQSRSRH
jgi:hypothetical protein